MKQVLWVALGGAAGAVCRYGLSLIPMSGKFPVATLLTNLLGAVLIGFLTGLASGIPNFPPQLSLLLKTGFCGGFTTFSTFSLETVLLAQQGRRLTAGLYAGASLALCLAGVVLGSALAKLALRK